MCRSHFFLMTKLLLDTDIGSDVDDSVCLAWLLLEPDCDLLGITTVTGDVATRASLADALCRRAGRSSIRIHPGLANPLFLPDSRQPQVPQATALRNWPHATPDSFVRHEAIHFLQHTIRKYPGEITLLAIGPLTNVAALFTIDPEIPALLKSLVIMGGNFTPVRWHAPSGSGRVEWNIWNDPHAADIVYRAPVRQHRSIGIDVTSRVNMRPTEVRQKFQHPILDLALDLAKVWFDSGRDEITFHDPLAAVTIFEPDLCQYALGQVEIATSGLMEGFTLFNPDAPASHEIAIDVDAERFFDRYFSRFT